MENSLKFLDSKDRLEISRFLASNEEYKRYPLIVLDENDKLRILNTYLTKLTVHNLDFRGIPELIESFLLRFSVTSCSKGKVRSLAVICKQPSVTEIELCLLLYSILVPLAYTCFVCIFERLEVGDNETKVENLAYLAQKYFSKERNTDVSNLDLSQFTALLLVEDNDQLNRKNVFKLNNINTKVLHNFTMFDVKTSRACRSDEILTKQLKAKKPIFIDTENIYTTVEVEQEGLVLKPLFESSIKPLDDEENKDLNNAPRISIAASIKREEAKSDVKSKMVKDTKTPDTLQKDFPFYTFYDKSVVEDELGILCIDKKLCCKSFCKNDFEYSFFLNDVRGLKARRIRFLTRKRVLPCTIENIYSCRSDYLSTEILDVSNLERTKVFSKGREDQVKKYSNIPNIYRKLEFHENRKDMIFLHEELLKDKVINIQYFPFYSGDQQQMIKRKIKLCQVGKKPKRKTSVSNKSNKSLFRATIAREDLEAQEVEEVIDYYDCLEKKQNQLEKVEYKIHDSVIHVFYARKIGSMLQEELYLDKVELGLASSNIEEKSSNLSTSLSSSGIDKVSEERKRMECYKHEVYMEHLRIWCLKEKESFIDIRGIEKDLMRVFRSFKHEVSLEETVIKKIKIREMQRAEEELKRQHRSDTDQIDTSKEFNLYLDPFLERRQYYVNERDHVLKARESCLQSYKAVLLSRAKFLEDELIKEKLKLENLKEDEDDIIRGSHENCDPIETADKLSIKVAALELRIEQEESISLENFKRFEEKLRLDKRLRILYSRV